VTLNVHPMSASVRTYTRGSSAISAGSYIVVD
jgi:hypothetical protein